MEHRDEIISWLNDAHAMERALEITLDKQANNQELHRAIRQRAAIHLDETRAHAERLEQCLNLLGTSPSAVKDIGARTLETAKKFTSMLATDERVKDYLAATGSEYFEVACYKALIVAARQIGQNNIVPSLEQNLKEDQAMARWLDDNIETIIREYFGAGAPATAATA